MICYQKLFFSPNTSKVLRAHLLGAQKQTFFTLPALPPSSIYSLLATPLHPQAPCLSQPLSVARLMTVISEQPPAEVACSSGKTRHCKQPMHKHTHTDIKQIYMQHTIIFINCQPDTHAHTEILHTSQLVSYKRLRTRA